MVTLIPKLSFHSASAAHLFPYQALLEAVKTEYDTVETAEQLYADVREGNLDELFSGDHYSARANEIVGNLLAEATAQRYQTIQRSRDN